MNYAKSEVKYLNLNKQNEEHYRERTKRNHHWLGGWEGQKKIRSIKVAVAGLGGMGSQTAELLARLGVGEIRISDPDTIDRSNINRQIIATESTLGKTKRGAMAARLLDVASDINIVVYPGVTADNAEEFVEGCDAVVDEIDVFPLQAHRFLHASSRKRNLPIYSAYIVGVGTHFYKFEGEAYTLDHFLGEDEKGMWDKPSAEYLLRKFGPPLPSYLLGAKEKAFSDQIATGGVPIFGPATLMGQSLVATRLIVDHIGNEDFKVKTPTMPEYIAVDYADLSLKICKVGNSN